MYSQQKYERYSNVNDKTWKYKFKMSHSYNKDNILKI